MCFISHKNILLHGICPLITTSRQCMICNYLQYSIGQRVCDCDCAISQSQARRGSDVFDDRGLPARQRFICSE